MTEQGMSGLIAELESEQKRDFELNSKEFWWNAGLQKAIALVRKHMGVKPQGVSLQAACRAYLTRLENSKASDEYMCNGPHVASYQAMEAAILAALTSQDSGVVQVCPDCDITGCKHLRASQDSGGANG